MDRRYRAAFRERPDRGAPSVEITGISFNENDLQNLIDEHCGAQQKPKPKPKLAGGTAAPVTVPSPAVAPPAHAAPRQRTAPDLSVLNSGALLLTVNQVKSALEIGHTKAYEMINDGRLERVQIDGSVRITSASVRRLADPPS